MATRKYSGPKHHSRRYHSNDNNRRRLSKQEEIDLTLDVIDLKDENIDKKENNCNINLNIDESTVAPITIHVNNVEDGSDQKVVIENERCDNSKNYNEIELGVIEKNSMHKSNSYSGQSSLGVVFNKNESNCLSTGDNKEKKRGKQLTRAEAVRDNSMSPPPQNCENEENNSNMLSVISSNNQSQLGSLMSTQNLKTSKIKAQGSSHGSLDRSSPCLSRDSSTENYSDSTGTDLQQFLTETLQKNKKDRILLLKIEQELTQLVKEPEKLTFKFPQMSSYNRMLVHRVAAFFGFEHNVDSTGTSIVVNKTKNTRIPEMKFRDYIKDELLLHEPKKSILKRDSASLEDGSQVSFDGKERSPDRQTGNISDGSRSKSFEEREERYEKARARIFNQDSSSSTEGNETNLHVILDENGSNDCSNNTLIKSNSSLLSSQEDMPLNWTNSDTRAWSSTDSDSSGRLPNNEKKQSQQSVPLKAANSSDSDTTPKSTTMSSSSSSCGTSLLTPDGCNSESNNNCIESKNRPLVTKASSFGGISRIIENSNCIDSNSTQTLIAKSLNVTQNPTQPIVMMNNVNPSHTITPKTNVKPDNAHKQQFNNMGHPSQQQQQRFIPSQHHLSNTSHHNRQNWHQNVHSRPNERQMASIGNVVQWPPIMHQNYPQFLLHQQTDSNVNQLKDNSYLQSGQKYLVSPLSNYGNQSINNEQQQHLTQQPLRLVYQNQPQMQNFSSFGALVNNSVQSPNQTFSSQLNQVPYHPIHSSQSALNFTSNQSSIQNNSNAFNQVMQTPSISHTYGAPVQIPSGVGTVWIINNGVSGTTSSPMIGCPPPANTPPTPPFGSNIAPFVGMSYQQFRPTMNSAPNVNPNYGLSAAQNRPQNSLLKTQSLLASQSLQANTQRILPSNGNHYIQQVPELVDMNLLGTNNFVNRTSIVSNPQMNQMFRRMPMNSGLDVRLIGSQQQSSPFLLPTPQRPYFPLSNSINVNHRFANANQRSRNSFAKNNRQQRNNANNKNILVPNSSPNT